MVVRPQGGRPRSEPGQWRFGVGRDRGTSGWPGTTVRHERSHPHPLGDRAGRPAGGRAAPAAGLRRAAQAGRAEAGPGEARPDAPGHGPGPRGVPAAGRTARRPSTGTAAATSSPPRPRRCAASSSRTPAASKRPKRGGDRKRVELDDPSLVATPNRWTSCSPSTRRWSGSHARIPRPPAGQAPLLRRAVDRGGGRGRSASPAQRPTSTGPTPGPGSIAGCVTSAGRTAVPEKIPRDLPDRIRAPMSHC